MSDNPFVGKWSYRSFLERPKPGSSVRWQRPQHPAMLFGYGTIVIAEARQTFDRHDWRGGWSLTLHGLRAYGSPAQVRFRKRNRRRRRVDLRLHWMAGSGLAEQHQSLRWRPSSVR